MAFLQKDKLSGHIDKLIDLAIDEDLGSGDITTDHLPDTGQKAIGRIIAKEQIVLAGIHIAQYVFEKFDKDISFHSFYKDGDKVISNQVVAEIAASMRALLIAERTVLNFLQHMSGVATHVRKYVDMVGDKPVRLVDTRKTVPGWRVLDKYAVRVGGAFNHRMGLFDGVLIKDNHIAASGGIKHAVNQVRKKIPHLIKIEVETSNLQEVKEALDSDVDVIMLDNMSIEEIREAVRLINRKAIIEVSGRVDKENLMLLADSGVNIISMGALTHSAVFVDISMKISPLQAV